MLGNVEPGGAFLTCFAIFRFRCRRGFPGSPSGAADDSYHTIGGLNHVGIVVDDLAATEAKVKAQGFVPHSHADYEPGERFYFRDGDGIEFEVVSYR